ncbi:MAG: transcriptional regulator [Thermodesulfobacteriota bacterium]
MTMDIKPIRTEEDYNSTLARIEEIWDAKPGTPESDELDVLAVLVEAYEDEHHPIDPPDPIEAIRFRMDQMGLTRKDLEPLIGSRGRVAEVLNKKRGLSIGMIRNLTESLGIPAEVLIARTRMKQASKA